MATTLPTGNASFMFTDVEGSTRLWQVHPEGMKASLEQHDQIMRSAIAAHNGHVFSTAGDAFAVAFHHPDDAVRAALQVQRALAEADWEGPAIAVRMGIHTGQANERDGDYFGPVLNRGARIMSAGHGGQILLSSATAEVVDLDDEALLHDLGTHHLKDLDEPEHVFEIRHPGLPVVETQIRTLDVRRHNLPDYLTSFVGRDQQLDELDRMIGENRLVALTGVGGTGKTRLAVEVARQAMAEMPDGVWLVELAPVTNPKFIMTTIGETWGLRPGEGATIEDVVTRYLWPRKLMVVIDNCEHLLDSAAAAIKVLLDSCPTLKIVATSRESLGIPGEATLRVPSLGLADDSHTPAESEAARLFLDRARGVRPGFEPSADELEEIGRICARIDGIPLGLELAAARLRSMSTGELASRLEDSFRILAGSAKTALPRQRTLHATIDWSYDMLEPAEQAMFRRLSLFTGSFNLEAAEAVCVGDGVEEWEVVDHIDSLVDKSLVVPLRDSGETTRYRLLEPVRQYAQERLSDTSEPLRYRRAHSGYFAGLAAEASPMMRGPEQLDSIARLEPEYDNMRSAFATFLETGEFDGYLQLAFDLYAFWMLKGMQLEGIATGLAGLEAAGDRADPLLRVKIWYTTARFGAEITSPAGVEHARAGLEVARETGDPNAIGRMELALGSCIRHATTDPEYLEHLLEGRRLLEAHPEPHWWNPTWELGLQNLLFAAYLPSSDERTRDHYQKALETFEETGDRFLLAATLGESAGFYFKGDRDDAEWALANLARSCEILSEMDSPNWYGHALYYHGILLRFEEEIEEASSRLEQGSELLDEVGDANCWAGATRHLVACDLASGHLDRAAARLEAVMERMPVLPMQHLHKPSTLDAIAETLLEAGRSEDAGRLIGLSLSIPSDPEAAIRPAHLESLRQRVSDLLGEDEAKQLYEQGASLELDEALEQGLALIRG
ncbi:MAG TPA: adenylate/guanylate cyclase domain-containing protein [Acidimicrobiia bacterium]|nr:adenylate/guanylate cyclase domain-containing protein [Acidimicrobiia bacterium]